MQDVVVGKKVEKRAKKSLLLVLLVWTCLSAMLFQSVVIERYLVFAFLAITAMNSDRKFQMKFQG